MPLPKRCVEPVHVSRGTVPERLALPSELEAVTNGTLANTVRQLSSLSKHAEDMFGELSREATNLAERTNVLQARIDRLAIKVTQLDSGVEEVSIQDIQMRKAFRSSRTFQQQLFSRDTIPSAMLATYAKCDRPPPLELLNEFRDDGKDARKFYTDPGYFFELWRKEMLQDTERIQHDRGKKVRPARQNANDGRSTRRVRQPNSTRERQKAAAMSRGEAIMAPSQLQNYTNVDHRPEIIYQATTVPDGRSSVHSSNSAVRPNSIDIEQQRNSRQPRISANGHAAMSEECEYGSMESPYGSGGGTPRRARPSQPPPAPPALHSGHPAHAALPGGASPALDHHTPTRCSLPPPPPPPESPPLANGSARTALDAHLDNMHAVIGMMSSDTSSPAPPPPPPPPPAPPLSPGGGGAGGAVGGAGGPGGVPRPPSPGALARGAMGLKPRPEPEPRPDPRSDLLKAIRDGIKLRKVEKRSAAAAAGAGGRYDTLRGVHGTPAFLDVASILSRRLAVELSDSDSEPDSDSDSEQWSESRA